MTIDLTSAQWGPGEAESYRAETRAERPTAGSATGSQGAVTVAHGAWAARAGLEAIKQGGNALDAALTTAMAQVALTAGSPISYFGIMSLVYLDAKTGEIHTMNAEWNTVRDEQDALSIPGALNFSSADAISGKGAETSGRTALVGGFMKGVESAHRKFGKLPFASLFGPSIEIAEEGIEVDRTMAWCYEMRRDDLARLPATAEALLKPDGSGYVEGETLRQPKLAETLSKIATEGADYMYGGEWGRKLVDAVRADGGVMTLEDLTGYEVIWAPPIVADIGDGYSVATSPFPNAGGFSLIEAQNLANAAGLTTGPHWSESGASLKTALDITGLMSLMFLPASTAEQLFPGLDFSPESRVTVEHAEALWPLIKDGSPLANWKRDQPMHSDDVVAIDAEGNIAAITHSINCVFWGKTAINIDGISVGDPASFQQPQVAATGPGGRLPAPTETGIVLKDGTPVLGFASMGAGLHHRTFQGLLNYRAFGMSVAAAIDAPDFYLPAADPATGEATALFPAGRFDRSVLADTGILCEEVLDEDARLAGSGIWVAIERDPATGVLSAASSNRNNSAAVAF